MAFQEGPKRVKAGNSLLFTRKMRFHEVEQYSHWDFAHWDLVKIWAGKGKAPAPPPVANFATFALRCFIKMFFLAVMVDAVLLVSRSQYSGSNGIIHCLSICFHVTVFVRGFPHIPCISTCKLLCRQQTNTATKCSTINNHM